MTSQISEGRPDWYDVEVYVEEGWNLVLAPEGFDNESIYSNSEIQAENIFASYIYFPEQNKYLLIHPYLDEEGEEIMESLDEFDEEDSDTFARLGISPVWVYSDKAGYFRYTAIDVSEYNQVKLLPGWNFFTVTPNLIRKYLKEFKGTCDIWAIASWESSTWTMATPEAVERGDFDSDFSSRKWSDVYVGDNVQDAGYGFLIYVPSECQLG